MEIRTVNKILRRAIGIVLGVLIGLFILLTFLGVINGANYIREKSLWRLNQQLKYLARDPDHAPSVVVKELIYDYRDFIKNNQGSNFIMPATIQLSKLYVLDRDNGMARDVLEKVLDQYKDQPDVAIEAINEIVKIYDNEGNFNGVINTYSRINKQYPSTLLGLKSPLLIVEAYEAKGYPQQAQEALNAAIQYYEDFIASGHKDVRELAARGYLGESYVKNHEWQSAVGVYEETLTTFANTKHLTPQLLDRLVRSINTISIIKLNDYNQPNAIYEKFIEEHPNHWATPILRGIMQGLYQLSRNQ